MPLFVFFLRGHVQVLKILIFLSAIYGLTGCFSKDEISTGDFSSPNEVTLMTFNVENLFDTKHDRGTYDQAYLPLKLKKTAEHRAQCEKVRKPRYRKECLNLDWSPKVLQAKLKNLTQALSQVKAGRGPDLLFLSEVENLEILETWRSEHLSSFGYGKPVFIEGFDKRGIDVAFLTRLPVVGTPKLHKIPFQKYLDRYQKTKGGRKIRSRSHSRGILQADFRLPDGQILRAFAVHFPSGANPVELRIAAADFLDDLLAKAPKEFLLVAGGDFNISHQDERQKRIYRDRLSPYWLVSHLIGCSGCQGTNYYHPKKEWSFLDALLFDPRFDEKKGSNSWYIDASSIRLANGSPIQTNSYGQPQRFSPKKLTGVSDHWPLIGALKKRKVQIREIESGP